MSIRLLILALSLIFVPPTAIADDKSLKEPPAQAGLPLSAFLTEQEMRLMLDYLRDAMLAALRGERYRMPPELAHTLARVQERIMHQGYAAVRQKLEMLEKELSRTLKEMKPPAPEPRPERTRY